MIAQVNKDISKLVKSWAVSLGFKTAKVHVRASSGNSGYISLRIVPEKSNNVMEPLRYERLLPTDICRRMLLTVYPNAGWVVNSTQCTGGNISTNSVVMTATEWHTFLNGEGFSAD